MRRFRFLTFVVLLCTQFLPSWRAHAIPVKQLPPYYRKWLEQDVVYIISQDERKEFLTLTKDAERDRFIQAFWESRNPDPGSPINTFKEEHYRRLAYVRANFGDERYDDGWRTDMGRVYITLGPPKQTAKHHIGRATRPVEIWFYESQSPALPPYFNLVFYKRSESDPYTLYSPAEDGPTRIVTNDIHDDAQALHVIDQSLGAEAAHAMLTLIPGEPVNLKDPRPTLDSEVLLAQVRNLPDQKLEKDRISRLHQASREKVTASIFTGGNPEALDTAVLRDERGDSTIHLLVHNQLLDPKLIGTLPDKRTGYDLTLQTRVISSEGKALYQQTDTFAAPVSENAAKAAKEKLFGAESRLPVPPGSYEIEATLTNNLTREATRTRKRMTVPDVHPETLGISDVVAYTSPSPVRDPDGQLPFSIAKLRFTPQGCQTVYIHSGEKLPLLYQIWLPSKDAKQPGADAAPKKLQVHYVIGSVAGTAGRPPLEDDESIEVKNLDAAGNLLTGHTFDTATLQQGTYRLVIKVVEPGVTRSASTAITVKVMPPETTLALWTAYGDESQHPAWRDEVLRGVVLEKQGRTAEAEAAYKRAQALNADAVEPQDRLAALHKKLASTGPAPAR